jgi:D-glutamate cyclase
MTIDEKLSALRDVIQFDIGNRGLARDLKCNLINAYPDDFANACRSIAEHPSPSIAIITGFYIAGAKPPAGETDGPLGAVHLARAFSCFGVPVIILTDGFMRRPLGEGLQVCDLDKQVAVLPIPPTEHSLKGTWVHIADPLKLTHFVAIERVGPAGDDRCYTMRGHDVTDFTSPAHLLIEHALEHDPQIVTIGIGDGGNEIGMGKIPIETIERNIANGRQIGCRIATDHLIVAGISNWGAYALAAGVALIRGQSLAPVFFDAEREREILQHMVEHGPLVDGVTGQRTVTVDGVAFDHYIRPLARIREIFEAKVESLATTNVEY